MAVDSIDTHCIACLIVTEHASDTYESMF